VNALRNALLGVLGDGFDLVSYIRAHDRPVKILFTGVNGTGKTTTVAKIASYLKKQGFSVVIGAGDTFRAGALEQIDVHADRLGIKIIQHQEGADPLPCSSTQSSTRRRTGSMQFLQTRPGGPITAPT